MKLNKSIVGGVFSLALLSTTFASALSAEVWNITPFTLGGGGTVSGSFSYDPTALTYSNVNITTTSDTWYGQTIGATTWSNVLSGGFS